MPILPARAVRVASLGVLLLLSTILLLPLAAAATAAAPVTPASEATRLAWELRAAPDAASLNRLVRQLLAVFQVRTETAGPGLDAAGPSLGAVTAPAPSGQPGIGLAATGGGEEDAVIYDVEIEAVAKAFKAGTLVHLDDVVASWVQGGMIMGPGAGVGAAPGAGGGSGQPALTGAIVEQALRTLRRQAQGEPDNWDGLLVRLIDELAHRPENAFDLMAPSDSQDELPGAGKLTASSAAALADRTDLNPDNARKVAGYLTASESLAAATKQAEAAGDREGASFLKGVQSDDNMESTFSALSSGNPMAAMSPFMQGQGGSSQGKLPSSEAFQNAMQKANAAMAQAMAGGGKGMPPEVQQLMQATQQSLQSMQPGSTEDAAEGGLKQTKAQRDMLQSQVDVLAKRGAANVAAERAAAKAKDGDAQDYHDVGGSEMTLGVQVDSMKDQVTDLDKEIEKEEKELKDKEDPHQWDGLKGLPLGPQPTTKLMLDAVQVLLVQIDIFGLAQTPVPEGGLAK